MYINWLTGDMVQIGVKVEDFCGTQYQFLILNSYDIQKYPDPLNITCNRPNCSFFCLDTRNREVVFYSCMNYHRATNDVNCSNRSVDKFYRELGRVRTNENGIAVLIHTVTSQDLADYSDAVSLGGYYNIVACINDSQATGAHAINFGIVTVKEGIPPRYKCDSSFNCVPDPNGVSLAECEAVCKAPPPENIWSVIIYYITQNDVYDPDYLTKINAAMNAANKILNDYNGTRLDWVIEKVNVPATINIRKDISIDSFGIDTERAILGNIPTFRTNYPIYDVIFLVIHGTSGGAYSFNYMSPIWFSWSAFTTDMESIGGMGIVHEFLHPFGLQDRPGGLKGCIMSDLSPTNKVLNLCDQAALFKRENYKKTPIDGLIPQVISRYRTQAGVIISGRVEQVGSIQFITEPSGAEIFLDGTDQNTKTPRTITSVPIGSHTYTLKLSGYDDAIGTLFLLQDQTVQVSVSLTKKGMGAGAGLGITLLALGALGALAIATRG